MGITPCWPTITPCWPGAPIPIPCPIQGWQATPGGMPTPVCIPPMALEPEGSMSELQLRELSCVRAEANVFDLQLLFPSVRGFSPSFLALCHIGMSGKTYRNECTT